MIKNDKIFEAFVEYKYEDFYTKLFLNKYKKKKFLLLNDINSTSMHLEQFKTFKKYLAEERKQSTNEYVALFRKFAYDFIKDIKGGGDLL